MRNRNFYHIKTDRSHDDTYHYWWKSRDRQCVLVKTYNGYIGSVYNTSVYDCGKTRENNNYTNYNKLEHSAHHHKNISHHELPDFDQAFERGFKDGKYNKSYHNVYSNKNQNEFGDQKREYSHGYEAGVKERKNRTSYHSENGSGYTSHEVVNDLAGKDAVKSYETLRIRGFIQLKEHKSDGKTYRIWLNKSTDQCIKTISKNYKIASIKNSDSCY